MLVLGSVSFYRKWKLKYILKPGSKISWHCLKDCLLVYSCFFAILKCHNKEPGKWCRNSWDIRSISVIFLLPLDPLISRPKNMGVLTSKTPPKLKVTHSSHSKVVATHPHVFFKKPQFPQQELLEVQFDDGLAHMFHSWIWWTNRSPTTSLELVDEYFFNVNHEPPNPTFRGFYGK